MSNVLHKHTISREHGIDVGHRVFNHEGKCANLHGHRYTYKIFAQAEDGLDKLGRVCDFNKIKEVVCAWLDEHWDHGMIVWESDPYAQFYKRRPDEDPEGVYGEEYWTTGCMRDQKHFILPTNPTAENLSSYLFIKANELMKPHGIKIVKIECGETPNCAAEVVVA